jgi:hypothetical protein
MIRPELHRRDGRLDVGVGRQEDDQRVGIEFLQLAEDGDAIEIGQLVIEQDEIDALLRMLQCLGAILRFEDLVAFTAQALRERPANQLFIVDDEDRGV